MRWGKHLGREESRIRKVAVSAGPFTPTGRLRLDDLRRIVAETEGWPEHSELLYETGSWRTDCLTVIDRRYSWADPETQEDA